MYERSPHDRRRSKAKTRFPVNDSKGELVQKDRRMQADRRLSGIQAEWSEMICDAEQPSDQEAQPK
ncbi:MAG: hypothetical protein WBO37_11170 [Gammaproteobacteria bacterium]